MITKWNLTREHFLKNAWYSLWKLLAMQTVAWMPTAALDSIKHVEKHLTSTSVIMLKDISLMPTAALDSIKHVEKHLTSRSKIMLKDISLMCTKSWIWEALPHNVSQIVFVYKGLFFLRGHRSGLSAISQKSWQTFYRLVCWSTCTFI